ncbi:MAG: SIR2 family protein [Acidobacteriota bacterium]|nr:SIR2 family protein [Acidobacteriota bacterium]
MMMARDLVLFLGAGFSLDAGLPLMRDFSELSVKTQPGLESRRGYVGELLREAKHIYGEFRNWCMSSGLGGFDWNNVEDVFGVAEVLHKTGIERLTLGHRELPIAYIIQNIELWIWKTYHQLQIKRNEPPRALPVDRDPYKKLFLMLRDLNLAYRTTVVTTNYDIVVEYECFLHGILCGYPTKWDSNFSAGYGSDLFVDKSQLNPPGPIVSKLHGSINFFKGIGGMSRGIAIAADLGDGRDIGSSRGSFFKNEPAVVAVGAIELLHERYGRKASPAILPPSYAKLRREPWLTDMWRTALSALTDAREVIFIGYSLPPSDGFIRSLLAGVAARRSHTTPLNVTVIDCSKDVRKRYVKMFGAIKPCRHLKFADAIKTEIPRVLERLAHL